MRDQIVSDYAVFEPDGRDTWNPAFHDVQLAYRMGVLYALGRAFSKSGVDITSLDVVDIGCGNGRSTRAYQEFGLVPSQLCGLDFRYGAIEVARRMHPAIRYDVQQDGRLPFDDASVGWVSLFMVVSSIRSQEDRAYLAAEIRRILKPGGFLIYFDHLHALDTAGGDPLVPERQFSALAPRWAKQMRLVDFLADGSKGLVDRDDPQGHTGWRFGQGGMLSWVPRPRGLGKSIKRRLPLDLRRWMSNEPMDFDIRLFAK